MGRRIKSSFNIFKHGRMNHNNRPYLVKAVQRVLSSKETKEKLALREAFGYFGHGKRVLTDKLEPEEIEVVSLNGKSVVLDDEPACITVDVECDNDGNITFTQELLDTAKGLAVDAMEKAKAGGWSWAVRGTPDNITKFAGFDYVRKPSYVSNEKRQELMLESCGEVMDENSWIKHCFSAVGLGDSADLLLESWNEMEAESDRVTAIEMENLMLESVMAIKDEEYKQAIEAQKEQHEKEINRIKQAEEKRKELMLESVGELPVFLTQSQKDSFINMSSDDDVKVVKNMFESVSKNAGILPYNDNGKGIKINKQKPSGYSQDELVGTYDLCGDSMPQFPK